MTALSYTKALDRALHPLGFAREAKDWVRLRGDLREEVNLQRSWVDGSVTVNLFAKNLQTERILKSIACETALGVRMFGQRIGELIDGRDRWWKNDPDGPAELAEAVLAVGIPWFEQIQSLEDEAIKRYGRGTTGTWSKPNLATLAVTLFRLGALDEALSLFDEPQPKMANPTLVAEGRCVQRWLQDRARSGSSGR